jgi:hypothetical protein
MPSSYRLGRTLTAGYRGALDYVTYLQSIPGGIAGGLPSNKPPVPKSGTIDVPRTVIAVLFDTLLNELSLPPTSAFTVKLDGVATGTIDSIQITGATVELTMGAALAAGVITLDYTPGTPDILSKAGKPAPAFTALAID